MEVECRDCREIFDDNEHECCPECQSTHFYETVDSYQNRAGGLFQEEDDE